MKDKVQLLNDVNETIDFMRKNYGTHAIALLASGDPLFFGIGRMVIKEFGKDAVEICPGLSSIQLAFSRINEPWDDALLISLHGGNDPEKRRRLKYGIVDIPSLLARHHKIAVLTDRENNPSVIAEALKSSAINQSSLRIHVCEKLGYKDERTRRGYLKRLRRGSSLNRMSLSCNMQQTRYQGAERISGLVLPKTKLFIHGGL